MADVDMPDAGPSTPVKASKTSLKSSKAGASEGIVDGKKRFEVKKVKEASMSPSEMSPDRFVLVECCSSMGVGYCGGQLCYLQESHNGPL